MTLVGTVTGALLPRLAGVDSTPARGARAGAVFGIGIGMSVVGDATFFLLLSGFSGA